MQVRRHAGTQASPSADGAGTGTWSIRSCSVRLGSSSGPAQGSKCKAVVDGQGSFLWGRERALSIEHLGEVSSNFGKVLGH